MNSTEKATKKCGKSLYSRMPLDKSCGKISNHLIQVHNIRDQEIRANLVKSARSLEPQVSHRWIKVQMTTTAALILSFTTLHILLGGLMCSDCIKELKDSNVLQLSSKVNWEIPL